MLRLDLWANALIALAFGIVAWCIGWLWWHRRCDWPESWILALIFLCFIFCAAARLAHATYLYHQTPALVVMLDWFAGIIGIVGAVLLPGGIRTVRRLPTPQEHDANMRRAAELEMVKERLAWREEREKQLVELLDRQRRQVGTLTAILNGTNLAEETKKQITAVVQETQ